MSHTSTSRQSGITVIELVVVIVLVGIGFSLVYGALDNIYQMSMRMIGSTMQLTDTKSALHQIERDLSVSPGFLASATPLSSPLGADNSTAPWQWDDPQPGPHTAIISKQPVTTGGLGSESRSLVGDNSGGCPTSTFLMATRIYYVREASLYRRTLLPSTSLACGSPPFDQKQTCNKNNFAANPSVCKAVDIKLLDNVSSFSVDYYAQVDDPSPTTITPANSTSIIPNAKVIVVHLATTQKIEGKTNTVTSSMRMLISRAN